MCYNTGVQKEKKGNEIIMDEIFKLKAMLENSIIPFEFSRIYDGYQIRVYYDKAKNNEMYDCVWHSGSHGYSAGLLETFKLSDCAGFETAEEVFEGWKQDHRSWAHSMYGVFSITASDPY